MKENKQSLEKTYHRPTREWNIIDHQRRHINTICKELASIDSEVIKRGKKLLLKDLSEGSCYGEAVNFMLENGPDVAEIQLLDDDRKQQNVVRVQAHMNFDYELDQTSKEIKKILLSNDPRLSRKQLNDYAKIRRHLSRRAKKSPGLAQKLHFFDKILAFQNTLNKRIDALFRASHVRKLGEGTLYRKKSTPKAFAKEVITAYNDLQKEIPFTDIIYGFDFVDEEGLIDHAVLVQHTHLRIYDSAHGIYQYNTLKALKADLRTHIANLNGNTYVDYEAYTST